MGENQKNEILVGNKPITKYIMAATIIGSGSDTISIKARGKYISRAIRVAESIVEYYQWKKVGIETKLVDIETKEGTVIRVPYIEIKLKK